MADPLPQEEKKRFGRYMLEEHLGTGGMAQVYKVSTTADHIFTLKRIISDFSQNSEFIRMFLQEAKISISLKHPHIVRVFDFGNIEGSYFLTMEYVFGRDLGTLLKRCYRKKIPIPLEVVSHLILQSCEGLQYAHSKVDPFANTLGIIHRDISPPNILVTYNGCAKVADFGIAKALRMEKKKPTQTRSGVLKGKFAYMSPEQAQGLTLTPQSDVFSVGIVFYELLICKTLFYTEDEVETLERVRKANVVPPSSLREDILPELDRIVLKALAAKIEDRYKSCAEMATDLRAFLKKYYSRTDERTVALFLREVFQKDFNQRASTAEKEGWKDVLIYGGADDEPLLDRAFLGPTPVVPSSSISWEERVLHPSRNVQRFVLMLLFILSLTTLVMSDFWDQLIDRFMPKKNFMEAQDAITSFFNSDDRN